MIVRCRYPQTNRYENYGGRGIKVCDRWLIYENFLADMGRKPTPKHSIDRVDSDGHYEPGNCCWSTGKEQARNRRTTVFVDVRGKPEKVADLCDEFGLRPGTVSWRMKNGWPVEEALNFRPRGTP